MKNLVKPEKENPLLLNQILQASTIYDFNGTPHLEISSGGEKRTWANDPDQFENRPFDHDASAILQFLRSLLPTKNGIRLAIPKRRGIDQIVGKGYGNE